MTSDALPSSQPSIIQAIEATMNIMKSATVTRVQVGCHEGSGQDRCRGRERSQDHQLIHHSRLISWARMTISSWESSRSSLSRRDCQ